MDDILRIKAENLERCILRAREEYLGFEQEFKTNQTKQDAIVLNIFRACETAIDMGNRAIRIKSLGFPQSSREIFILLEKAKLIPPDISVKMQHLVGFRNIAVLNYTQLEAKILIAVIENELPGLLTFSKTLLATVDK